MTKPGDTYEAANPKHCGYALTFINIIHVPFNKRRRNKGRETTIYIHHWYVVMVIFSDSLQRKNTRGISFLPLLPQDCCREVFSCRYATTVVLIFEKFQKEYFC